MSFRSSFLPNFRLQLALLPCPIVERIEDEGRKRKSLSDITKLHPVSRGTRVYKQVTLVTGPLRSIKECEFPRFRGLWVPRTSCHNDKQSGFLPESTPGLNFGSENGHLVRGS